MYDKVKVNVVKIKISGFVYFKFSFRIFFLRQILKEKPDEKKFKLSFANDFFNC